MSILLVLVKTGSIIEYLLAKRTANVILAVVFCKGLGIFEVEIARGAPVIGACYLMFSFTVATKRGVGIETRIAAGGITSVRSETIVLSQMTLERVCVSESLVAPRPGTPNAASVNLFLVSAETKSIVKSSVAACV